MMGDPLYEKLNGCAARMVGCIGRIKSVARKTKVEDFDKSAAGKVVGDSPVVGGLHHRYCRI